MDKDDPRELELSLLALLDPVTDSSDGLLVRFPELFSVKIKPSSHFKNIVT